MSVEWFYALMVVVIIGGIWLEAYLDKRKKRKLAELRLRNR